MTVDEALEAGYWAAFEATKLGDETEGPDYTTPDPELARVFNTFLAAFLRSIAATPEMVEAGMAEIKPDGLPADRSDAAAAWSAMASALADQVEAERT